MDHMTEELRGKLSDQLRVKALHCKSQSRKMVTITSLSSHTFKKDFYPFNYHYLISVVTASPAGPVLWWEPTPEPGSPSDQYPTAAG